MPPIMDLTGMHASGCALHVADVLVTVCPTSPMTFTASCAISTAKRPTVSLLRFAVVIATLWSGSSGVCRDQMLRIEAGARRCALILPK
jgi:hypothetical protein